MAKKSGTILGSVRMNGKLFTSGMEDEFLAEATKDQIAHLTNQKAIEGFDGHGKAADKPADDNGPDEKKAGKGKSADKPAENEATEE